MKGNNVMKEGFNPGIDSFDKMIKDLWGNLLFFGNWAFVIGLQFILTVMGAFQILPFLRVNYGERAFSPLLILCNVLIIEFFASLAAFYNSSSFSMFFGAHLDMSLYMLHAKFLFWVSLGHYGMLLYRRYRSGKPVYSWSFGDSILWKSYKKLAHRIGFKLVKTEIQFQHFVEPIFIVLIGSFFYFIMNVNYGMFLMWCGGFLYMLGNLQESNFRNMVLNRLDGEIINRNLADYTSSNGKAYESTGGFKLFGSGNVQINEYLSQSKTNKATEQDTELSSLQKDQSLD